MEQHVHIPYLREVTIFLITAGVIVPLLQRRISPVLGYLLIGGLVGPFGLGLLADENPVVAALVISDLNGVQALAELGVVFLLFTIGLDLSFDRLWAMRRSVFGLGSTQILVTAATIGLLAWTWDNSLEASILLGACLALSSTAIVTQLLVERRRLSTPVGQTAFSVLLMQDLAVVPILFAVGIVSTAAGGGSLAGSLALAIAKAAGTVAAIYFLGRLLLRRLLHVVARTESREAFMAIILLIAIGTAAVTGLAGLSMALGAFLAGLLIAETEYRHQVEVDINPFKGLMLGLFFMSVGMGIDWRTLGAEPVLIAASVVGLIALKTAINIALCLVWGLPRHVAVETGLLLAQAGEFAFVVVGLAMSLDLLPQPVGQFMLIVAGLSMLVTPALAGGARRLGAALQRRSATAEEEAEAIFVPHLQGHVVLAGFGRVGRMIASVLDREQIPYLAIDCNPEAAAEARRLGQPVRFGDASRIEVLSAARVEHAMALVITIGDEMVTQNLTQRIRQAVPHVPLYVRARDHDHAKRLLKAGATATVPETVEGSLELAGRVLAGCGIDEDTVRHRLQLERGAWETG
ncbi:MAG TPA: monovalent cation:proton antiporter-2 (CPA2) family protein [Tianweitania sediminis]|nr:monovalent cation:proton antiporter-2 (CPA2) family protein [Tianweitania sediminis]